MIVLDEPQGDVGARRGKGLDRPRIHRRIVGPLVDQRRLREDSIERVVLKTIVVKRDVQQLLSGASQQPLAAGAAAAADNRLAVGMVVVGQLLALPDRAGRPYPDDA